MAGRTLARWTRVYVGGYDLSGTSRSIGPLITQFETTDEAALDDAVRGGLPAHSKLGVGTLNGFMDNSGLALHALHNTPGSSHVVLIAIGDKAAPAAGVPVYSGRFFQDSYTAESDSDSTSHVSIQFGDWDVANLLDYQNPWGNLLHTHSAETGANSSGTGVESLTEASTAFGGYMVYHGSGDGTATITVEHSADEVDGNYAALGGCTSGELDFSAVKSGIVATTAKTTTVNQYTRWQISLNTATTVTFTLSFHRNYHVTT